MIPHNLRLPSARGAPTGDRRRPERGGELELGNKDIFYGKADDLTGDDRESVEISALALHLVQAAIGYLNTQMIQIVLRDPAWRDRLTDTDLRGLSALFWSPLDLYGRFDLDMTRFMDLDVGEPAA